MDNKQSADWHRAIGKNIEFVNKRILSACRRSHRSVSDIKIIAVTKTIPSEIVRICYECGLRNFGENRVQEAEQKYTELADIRSDIVLHLIGHLQTNKSGESLKVFDLIQSLDSLKLADQLNRRSSDKVPVLLQVNISGEATKHGFSEEEVVSAMESIKKLTNIEIRGLMTIAPIASDPEEVRPIFKRLRFTRDLLGLKDLSMGMSDDFQVAVEEGATMVRIGRAIFGERRSL